MFNTGKSSIVLGIVALALHLAFFPLEASSAGRTPAGQIKGTVSPPSPPRPVVTPTPTTNAMPTPQAYRQSHAVKLPEKSAGSIATDAATIKNRTNVVDITAAKKPTAVPSQSGAQYNILGQGTVVSDKSLKTQADNLVPQNANKHRVTLRSPSQKMEVDLVGKPHAGIGTPHTKVSPRNTSAPNQPAYNTKKSSVRAATQQDMRTVRRYLERQEHR